MGAEGGRDNCRALSYNAQIMRDEIKTIAADIQQSLELLRRHL